MRTPHHLGVTTISILVYTILILILHLISVKSLRQHFDKERSSGEETVTEGLLPAVERSSEEETATVDGNSGQDPRTLDPNETRDQMTSDSDGRLRAVPRTMVLGRGDHDFEYAS